VLLDDAQDDADDVCIEMVPECGHFVPEEHPQLVAERARDLFGLR
jgi:pimeloyl-ACP methyl ester carboxylesterase